MKQLEEFTMREVISQYVEDTMLEHDVPANIATKLVLNAITYHTVGTVIREQICTLLEFKEGDV